jgi:hypothetical protein
MKTTRPWPVAALLALLLGTFAWPAESEPPPPDGIDHLREDEQCRPIGEVFYRLAEQRRAGVDEASATRLVAAWAGQVNQTGSHYIRNNTAVVADAARLVFRLKQLNSLSLGAFGRDSCKLQLAFASDEQKKTVATYELVNAAVACQKQHPGEQINSALGECIRTAESGIAAKLRTARVEIR